MKRLSLEEETTEVFQRNRPCEMKLTGNIFLGKPQENKIWRRMMQDHSNQQRGIAGYKQETNML